MMPGRPVACEFSSAQAPLTKPVSVSPIAVRPEAPIHLPGYPTIRKMPGPGGCHYPREPMHTPVWIVIPTYNEADNVEGIVRAAARELERVVPGGYHILVVDDRSPDGTGEIADRLAGEIVEVEVLHRAAKTGLGHAYLDGFACALSGGAERVIEMDADFSHDPAYLEPMLRAAEDADVVLGSRYVAAGVSATGACCGG